MQVKVIIDSQILRQLILIMTHILRAHMKLQMFLTISLLALLLKSKNQLLVQIITN